MDFFIPTIPQNDVEDFFKNSIVKFIESFGYNVLVDKRIYSITFSHNGKSITEKVGQISPSNREPIFVILETDKLYLTCTRNRGVLGGEPMIIGKQDVENIEYFGEENKNLFKYGDWTYKLHYNNHEVEHPKTLPESVYKYYYNNENSQNALINGYLFCSHPYHLNDSMDSSNQLWNFDKITKTVFNRFFDAFENNPIVDKRISYEDDLKNDFEYIKTAFWNIATEKAGIISLSENPLHTLMWAHYATEKGFMVEFDRAGLIERLKKYNPKVKNYVFMPIQYVEKLEQIDFFGKFTTPDVPFLYSINIKKDDWGYEKEWRLVCYSDGYGIPNSLIIPSDDYKGKFERKFYYDTEIIKSITLGKYFFHGKNLDKFEFPNKFWLSNKKDIELLEFMIKNFNDKLYFSNELAVDKKYTRSRLKIHFEKQDNNLYIMQRE
jgi:hypothetical protein